MLTQGDLAENKISDISRFLDFNSGKITLPGNPLSTESCDIIPELAENGVTIEAAEC